jgi:hypothetical protein
MLYIYGAAANASKWQMGFNSAFKGLIASTCFEHLFAHHQEVLYIQQLVYFVRIMSVGSYQLLYIQCLLMMSK